MESYRPYYSLISRIFLTRPVISTSMEPEAPPTSELYIAGALNIKKPDHKQALISTPRSVTLL